jgi:hypothetical protein
LAPLSVADQIEHCPIPLASPSPPRGKNGIAIQAEVSRAFDGFGLVVGRPEVLNGEIERVFKVGARLANLADWPPGHNEVFRISVQGCLPP